MPLHFLWTHHMHCEHWIELLLTTLEQAAPGYLPDFLTTANTRNQELGPLHVDMELFTFHTCLPCLELGDTLLLGVCDEQQVGSEEKLLWHTNAELMWKRLHHRDEEQWAKGRVLMHINSHTKLIIVLTIDLHMTLGIGVHDLNDTHSSLKLANNDYGASGASARHKGKLHLVDVNHLTDVGV